MPTLLAVSPQLRGGETGLSVQAHEVHRGAAIMRPTARPWLLCALTLATACGSRTSLSLFDTDRTPLPSAGSAGEGPLGPIAVGGPGSGGSRALSTGGTAGRAETAGSGGSAGVETAGEAGMAGEAGKTWIDDEDLVHEPPFTFENCKDADREPLMIATVALAPAERHKPYEFQLRPLGGAKQGYRFALSAGKLPRGLLLSADGLLSGVPEFGGKGTFQITLTDAVGTTHEKTFELPIYANEGQWLGALTGDTNEGHGDLYLIDRRRKGYPATLISSDVPSHWGWFAFSPDGRYLAYVHDPDHKYRGTLYLIDLTPGSPMRPIKVTDLGNAVNYGWSPDGRYLVYVPTNDVLTYADVTRGAPFEPHEIQPLRYLGFSHWFDERTLIYEWYDNQAKSMEWRYVSLAPNGPGPIGEFEACGHIQQPRGAPFALLSSCDGGTRYVNAKTGSQATFDSNATFSTSLQYVAAPVEPWPTAKTSELSRVNGDLSLEKRLTVDKGGAYRHSLGDLFWLGNVVVRFAAGRTHVISLCEGHGVEAVSPDGTWLALTKGSSPYFAGLREGRLTPPSRIDSPDGMTVAYPRQFSPDSQSILHTLGPGRGVNDTMTITELDSEAHQSTRVFHHLSPPESVIETHWSRDSEFLAYRTHANLYLFDTRTPDAKPVNVAKGGVRLFAFQP